MGKRFFAIFCTFLVCAFGLYSLVVRSASFSASAADGGGSHRVEAETDESILGASDRWQAMADFVGNCLDGEGSNVVTKFLGSSGLSDLLHMASAYTGAIFTDQTFSQVSSSFATIYANTYTDGTLTSEDVMHDIFYLGTDGNLYLTDEFISNFQQASSQASFNQGVVTINPISNSDLISMLYNTGDASILSLLNDSFVNGNPHFLYYRGRCSYSLEVFSTDGFSDVSQFFSDYVPIYAGSTYSAYLSNCSSGRFTVQLFDFDTSSFINPQCTVFGVNSYDTNGLHKILMQSIAFSPNLQAGLYSPSYSQQLATIFLGSSSYSMYTSVDWYKYYAGGGTGACYATGLDSDLTRALQSDVFDVDWGNAYKNWQKQYAALADDVRNGAIDLDQLNKMMGTYLDDIVVSVDDIASSTSLSTSLLKKILSAVEDISKKLTVSNVVGTVNAASNLLSSIGSALDSLFEEASDTFSLLDFVQDGLSDTMKSVFPFSLPHDLLLIYELLAVDPQVPQVDFHFDLARLGISYNYTYVANDFLKLAYISRFFSSIGFVMLLINLTNKMLKK